MTEHNFDFIKRKLPRVPRLSWYPQVKLKGFPISDWIAIKITPVTGGSELEQIISDIYDEKRNYYRVKENGELGHEITCNEKHDNLPDSIISILPSLIGKTYDIAIWDNQVRKNDGKNLLGGQPVFFAINPEINRYTDINHPHINTLIKYPFMSSRYSFIPPEECFCPESICYEQNIEELGPSRGKQILAAFDRVLSWLIKYEIWKELIKDKTFGENPWIGRQHYIDKKQHKELKEYIKFDLQENREKHRKIMEGIRDVMFDGNDEALG